MIDQSDIKKMINKFTDLEKKQMPYAAVLATNKLVFAAMEEQKKETLGDLVWKRKMLPNAIRYTKATKSNPYAELFLNEKSWTYYALKQHFIGGDRHRKGLEKLIKAKGYISNDEILIPVARIKVSVSKEIADELKSKPKKFFIITSKNKSHLIPGIYTRLNAYDKPILLFLISSKPKYKKRFDLKTTIIKIHRENGQRFLKESLDYAISTSK